MKRTLRSLLAIIASALLFTLVAAWACAWFRPAPGGVVQLPSFWKGPDQATWMGPGRRGLGWTEQLLYGASGLTDYGYEQAAWLPGWIDTPRTEPVDERAVFAISAGWPARCLRAGIIGRGDHAPQGGVLRSGLGPQRVVWGDWERAIVLDDSATDASGYRVLPRGVIPSGLILNLLFWSVPGLLIAMLLQFRRTVRRRHGRCAACGYPVGESDRCSECGSSVQGAGPAAET